MKKELLRKILNSETFAHNAGSNLGLAVAAQLPEPDQLPVTYPGKSVRRTGRSPQIHLSGRTHTEV